MTAADEVAVATALSVLGTPSMYGAADGDTSCFDCSSLVQRAWRHAGTALPRAVIDRFQALLQLAMAAAGEGYWLADAGGRVTRIGDGTW